MPRRCALIIFSVGRRVYRPLITFDPHAIRRATMTTTTAYYKIILYYFIYIYIKPTTTRVLYIILYYNSIRIRTLGGPIFFYILFVFLFIFIFFLFRHTSFLLYYYVTYYISEYRYEKTPKTLFPLPPHCVNGPMARGYYDEVFFIYTHVLYHVTI